jgi:hypothetical protein
VDEEILPFAFEWESAGRVTDAVCLFDCLFDLREGDG